MLITLQASKATFSCQRDLRAPFTTKSLRPSQTRHPQTHRPWMAPSTTSYYATLTHISRSQNYTLPTALRKKVWDWALSSPLSVHLGRLLLERAHPFPCRCTLSASRRGTLSSAAHTLQGHSWEPSYVLLRELGARRGSGRSKAAASGRPRAAAPAKPCHLQWGPESWQRRSHSLACAAVGAGLGSSGSLAPEWCGRTTAAICCEADPAGAGAGARRCWGRKPGRELPIRALSPSVPRAAAAAVEGVPSQGNYNGGLSQHQKSCYWAA